MLPLDTDEFFHVVVADILHHSAQQLVVRGGLAVRHPAADHAAQDAAEVLVAGIGQEGAGIREHAHKAAEHADAGQIPQLLFHAVQMVIKPPGRPELHLSSGSGIVEAASSRYQLLIV